MAAPSVGLFHEGSFEEEIDDDGCPLNDIHTFEEFGLVPETMAMIGWFHLPHL